MEKELTDNENEVVKSVNYLDQILYDIYSCILNNKDEADSKGYSRGLLKLYHVNVGLFRNMYKRLGKNKRLKIRKALRR